MKNEEFLRKASKLQKEYAEIYRNYGFVSISYDYIQITSKNFHEFERELLLEHISKKHITQEGAGNYWRYEAMTPQGVKIIAVDYASEIEDKR